MSTYKRRLSAKQLGRFRQLVKNKYKAEPTIVDNIRFASKHEANRWCELRLLERAGKITDLWRQVSFPIDINGVHITTYRSDFTYWDGPRYIVEDAKGVKTEVYKLKKKLMAALYKITILET
jgi:hypothetical protein